MEGGVAKNTALSVVALIIIAALAWWFYSARAPETPGSAVEQATEALEEVSRAPSVAVPTTQNPVRQVLPQTSPLEKANPFNDAYVNPFE